VQAWLKVHPEDPGALRRLARFQAALDSSRAVAAK
jgi:hypothetical protein